MRTSLGLLLLSLVLAAHGASLSSRIVGGSDAPDGKYPYQVALWRMQSFFHCGGSIINERYILTAAHCIYGCTTDELSIQVGSNVLIENGTRYIIAGLIPHPGFSPDHVQDDIGLVRLSEKIIFNDKVRPIALPDEDFTAEGSSAVLAGWGLRSVNGSNSDRLQHIELKIFDQKKCQEIFEVTSNEICTLTKNGEGICTGDSGGPLVADGFQIGVASRGALCGMGKPDVFTRVHAYRDWITNAMDLR